MKKFFPLVCVMLFCVVSCRKHKRDDATGNQHISLKLDGVLINAVASDNTSNISRYMFCTTSSCLFAYGFGYKLQSLGSINIWLGQINSSQSQISFTEFKNLFSPAVKIYDSLMVFNQVNNNRVQIEYHDENGKTWLTTHTWLNSSGNIEREVNQPGSSFVIDEIKEVDVNSQPGTVKIKGRFNCILYEKNGNGQKIITDAEFIALVVK